MYAINELDINETEARVNDTVESLRALYSVKFWQWYDANKDKSIKFRLGGVIPVSMKLRKVPGIEQIMTILFGPRPQVVPAAFDSSIWVKPPEGAT